MSKKIILQIDGGGILGITPAMVLAELEARLKTKKRKNNFLIRDMLTLCCGTSTGAIIAGFVVAGVNANDIQKFYCTNSVTLFGGNTRPIFTRFFKPKFIRKAFTDTLDKILKDHSDFNKADIRLKELPTSCVLMTTAYNLCSHRTHFTKSSDASDQDIELRKAIAWSALSAAYYFGKINEPNFDWTRIDNGTPPKETQHRGAVFQDGGQGTQNCTLDYVMTEIFSKGWDKDGVIIISLGTGSRTKYDSYRRAKLTTDIGQAIKYVVNQARSESTAVQKLAARYIADNHPKIQLFRLDYETIRDYDLDDVNHIDIYKKGAADIINSSIFEDLVAAI